MTVSKHVRNIRFIKLIRKNKGYTLIEVLITSAIMSLIFALLFAVNAFGVKTFAEGEVHSQHQHETLMAADFITEKLRFAKELTILNAVPIPTAGYYDIYIDNNKYIAYNKNGVVSNITGIYNVSDFNLIFSKINDNIISFTVGKNGDNKYDISTELIILNLSSSVSPYDKIIDIVSGSRIGVRFKLISPVLSSSIAPTVTPAPSTTNTPMPSVTSTPKPSSTTTPVPSITPKPSVTLQPTATPKPTPLPEPVLIASTDTEVVIEFFRNISDLREIFDFKQLSVYNSTKVRFVLYEELKNNTTVRFSILDVDGITKTCSIDFKNKGWEDIRLVDD